MTMLPKPIAMTRDKVVLSRATWEALLDALDDMADRSAIRESEARRKAGIDDGLPIDLYWRLRKGEHPIRVWRAQRSLSLNALAKLADVSPAYLSEVETRKKPGSAAALQRIAHALKVDMDELMPALPRRKKRRVHR